MTVAVNVPGAVASNVTASGASPPCPTENVGADRLNPAVEPLSEASVATPARAASPTFPIATLPEADSPTSSSPRSSTRAASTSAPSPSWFSSTSGSGTWTSAKSNSQSFWMNSNGIGMSAIGIEKSGPIVSM